MFSGLREHEVRSNPCLMLICRATHVMMPGSKGHEFHAPIFRAVHVITDGYMSGDLCKSAGLQTCFVFDLSERQRTGETDNDCELS